MSARPRPTHIQAIQDPENYKKCQVCPNIIKINHDYPANLCPKCWESRFGIKYKYYDN